MGSTFTKKAQMMLGRFVRRFLKKYPDTKKEEIAKSAVEAFEQNGIQYPTFEEFEEAVRKGKPCKLD